MVGVGEVDDDNLVLLVDLLAHADEVVGLESECLCQRKRSAVCAGRRGGDADCATRILAWNEMDAGWMPRLESWRCSQKAMGFEISMVVVVVVVVGRKEHVELVDSGVLRGGRGLGERASVSVCACLRAVLFPRKRYALSPSPAAPPSWPKIITK